MQKRTVLLIIFCLIVLFQFLYLFSFDVNFPIFRRLTVASSSRKSGNLLRFRENQTLWIVAANADPRHKNLVRVITAGNRSLVNFKPRCNFFYAKNSSSSSFLVQHYFFTTLPGFGAISVDGIFFHCYYNSSNCPNHVNITFDKLPTNDSFIVPVRRLPPKLLRNDSLASCLSPLHNVTNATATIMAEWIEINLMLGVEHFVIYNFSSTNLKTNRLLEYYKKRGIVEVIPWDPLVPTAHRGYWPPHLHLLHYFGQPVALSDCMYRLLNRYRWILMVDLDEFVVPRKVDSLKPMLREVTKRKVPMYIFLQAFFNKIFRNVTMSQVEKPIRVTNIYKKREPDIFKRDQEHKMIIEPGRGGDSVYVHNLMKFYPPNKLTFAPLHIVNPSIATMNHYRYTPMDLRKKFLKGRPPILDETMKRFQKKLAERLRKLPVT